VIGAELANLDEVKVGEAHARDVRG
jgi:hypothetical protein